MLGMITEFENQIVEAALAEATEPLSDSLKEQIEEWRLLKKKVAVIDKVAKAITGRIKELEGGFEEVVNAAEDKKVVVDNCILELGKKRTNRTVKYQEVVEYALKMVNEAQKEVIEKFMTSVTKEAGFVDVFAATDPEFEDFLLSLKPVEGQDILDKIGNIERFPRQIMNAKKRELKESVITNVAKVVKHLVSSFRTKFSKFFSAVKKRDKAVEKLVKAMNTPVKESVVNEMAAAHEFSSGWIKRASARELVKAFKAGEETFDLKNGKKYKAVKQLRGDMLEAGQMVFASYDAHNQGAEIYVILGFSEGNTSNDVAFKTAKELFRARKVTSLRGLSALDSNEAGNIVVKDLNDGDEGAFFYPYNGRWCRGSGAEPVSFTLIEEVK